MGKALVFAPEKLDALFASVMWWEGRGVIPQRLTEVGLDVNDLAVQQLMRFKPLQPSTLKQVMGTRMTMTLLRKLSV